MFTKKTIRDINLKGKRVLLRADYNVPVGKDGTITDDYRITQSVPTLEYLKKQGAIIIIISHLGRPKSPADESCSLQPVAKRLSKLLDTPVAFAPDCIGDVVKQKVAAMKPGDIILLENLRYHIQEEDNDTTFASELASMADVFVQDGFGVVHRAHASTSAITKFIPSVAGLLLEHEVDTITNVMSDPKRPVMAVIGGAKIADKITVLNRFIDIADFLVVGGAMANTFLRAQGVDIGKSLSDPDDVPLAKDILERAAKEAKKRAFVFHLPTDGVVAKKLDSKTTTRIVDWGTQTIADIEDYPKIPGRNASKVDHDELILDIGPMTGAFIAGGMQLCNTVIWNGALGVTETPAVHGPIGPFSHGTEILVDAMLGQFGHRPFSVVGGGDTVGYVESRKLSGSFDHVSTGGGAGLELMSGKKLPGVEALQNA
ncbi:MAG: phosphoglycerate kinase [Candidatus Saccharibacteria bacterium]